MIVRAILVLGILAIGLALLPFRWVLRLAAILARPVTSERPVSSLDVEQIAKLVIRASTVVPAATCLPQALTTKILLGRRGVSVQLRIGVAKASDGRLIAHAWVEHKGRVLVGDMPGLTHFVELPSLENVLY